MAESQQLRRVTKSKLDLLAWLLVGAALVRCSSDPPTNSSAVCVPNQQIECSCGMGKTGAQACKSDGSGYDDCVCGTLPTGTAGAAGAAGAAPDNGCGTVSAAVDEITATVYTKDVSVTVPDAGYNAYHPADDATELIMSNADGDQLNVYFPGKSTGTFECGAAFIPSVLYAGPNGYYAADSGNGSCSITVTEYGCVGEAIRGTFVATAQQDFASSQVFPGVSSIAITGGTFDVTRLPDGQP